MSPSNIHTEAPERNSSQTSRESQNSQKYDDDRQTPLAMDIEDTEIIENNPKPPSQIPSVSVVDQTEDLPEDGEDSLDASELDFMNNHSVDEEVGSSQVVVSAVALLKDRLNQSQRQHDQLKAEVCFSTENQC